MCKAWRRLQLAGYCENCDAVPIFQSLKRYTWTAYYDGRKCSFSLITDHTFKTRCTKLIVLFSCSFSTLVDFNCFQCYWLSRLWWKIEHSLVETKYPTTQKSFNTSFFCNCRWKSGAKVSSQNEGRGCVKAIEHSILHVQHPVISAHKLRNDWAVRHIWRIRSVPDFQAFFLVHHNKIRSWNSLYTFPTFP